MNCLSLFIITFFFAVVTKLLDLGLAVRHNVFQNDCDKNLFQNVLAVLIFGTCFCSVTSVGGPSFDIIGYMIDYSVLSCSRSLHNSCIFCFC